MTVTERFVARVQDVRCVAAQQALLAPFARTRELATGHAGRCLVCQAEEARERSLTRLLSMLRAVEEPAPEGFVDGVVAALGRPKPPVPEPVRTPARSRLVLVASASALAVGVAVAASRRLRPASI